MFGVKIYYTAADKSNFTVTVHTENINSESSTLVVYGSQTANQPTDNSLTLNINHFIGQFKALFLDMDHKESNSCKYVSIEKNLLPYIYLRVFSKVAAVKVCEVKIA